MSSAEASFRPRGVARVLLAEETGPGGIAWLVAYLGLMLLGAIAVTAVAAFAVARDSAATWFALALVALGATWISGGAATAILGACCSPAVRDAIPDHWLPSQATAILVLLCGEPPEQLARYLRSLRRRADAVGLGDTTRIFVLSDTQGGARIAAEEAALAPLVDDGCILYRRRVDNTGRKPGNIADWLASHGEGFACFAVLDADSRMSADRIRALIHRMEQEPRLGLLQAGIGMVPGRSRFGRHQRLASRLLTPNFGRGLAAWVGDTGNYWGHNAIIRVDAFRSAASLPVLRGRPPFGGPPLSHDFVEAAWIRRDGWTVALDADTRGSAEDGPQSLGDFHRRDRRWCQGNLQHLRLLCEPGLHPISRLHLASGIVGYLVAPAWLLLMLLIATDVVVMSSALPLLIVAAILLLPKLLACAQGLRRARTAARRRLVLRAGLSELALSTLVAPLVMLRQSGAVLAVVAGRDCGWMTARAKRFAALSSLPEFAAGVAFLVAGALGGSPISAAPLLPIALPLLCAPLLQPWLDAQPS
jgi:membrane glycosyltransferase